MGGPWPLTQSILPAGAPSSEQLQAILLASFALLVSLAFTNWLIAWRLAGQARTYRDLARAMVRLARATDRREQNQDPHAALCQVLARVTGQRIDALTPLAGSEDPPYLLLREDNTRRRLLLAGAGKLKHAQRSLKLRERIPRRQRWTIQPSARTPMALETIVEAWAALAPGLGLPPEAHFTTSWELALLPPEELG